MHKVIYMVGMAVILLYIYNRRLNITKNRFFAKKEEYINEEIMFNEDVYKKDIPSDYYVKPIKDDFPFKEYEVNDKNKKIIKKQQLASRKIELEMMIFPDSLTNTDIKKEYGRKNLERIMILEEHYNDFMRSLLNWAEELISIGEIDDAAIILEKCVYYKGDITKIYTHLADIYKLKNNKDSLILLKEQVINSRCIFKENVLKYIDDRLNEV